jgi:hypothetical protein
LSDEITVFVNERPLRVAHGATVLDVVTAQDPALDRELEQGTAYVTDGVGRRVTLETPVEPGAILRVVRSARTKDAPDRQDR